MKGLKALTTALLGVALLAASAPASSPSAPKAPPAYRHYVACGWSQNAKPSHSCRKWSKKGAFFKSNNADVGYTVCVKFPKRKRLLCAKTPHAATGQLYVNPIIGARIPGVHRVTWFVGGKRVGVFYFRVTGKRR
jgi:hypothetical protein